ncbi:hypothetical protein FE783_17960 [Paenibacillus mesophilus]|uniref:hypothetical protein n=1 Tax=Paenibacillus mesophilus TaxID=2582849 RepID=UPI00110F554B|nr:hypothetical protein [Paenibacillus mesophilus]TMV48401.1 hypothetical protein FE783_17960 [Paenibacillus mesophilus]
MKHYRSMLGAGIVLSIFLSGCASQPGTQPSGDTANAAGAQGQNAPSAQAPQNGQNGTPQQRGPSGMSEQSMNMMTVFRSIPSMDKTDGLTITKEQAAYMLPLVQDIAAKGELTDESKAKLIEKLSTEQKQYIADASTRMPGGANGRGGQGDRSQGGDRPQGSDGPQAGGGGKAQSAPSGGNMQSSDSAQGAVSPGGGRPGGAPGAGGMNNIGQQLVELLQSKTK